MKKYKNFKIKELKSINNQELSEIIKLIKNENPESILASLQKNIIKNYINKVVVSNDFLIFVLQGKKKIIAYAILVKNVEKLTSIFSDMKIKILLSLIINLKFIKLTNIILGYLKIDLIFIEKKYKNIIRSNINLNLLAVEKKYQSQGLGTYFLNKILNRINKSKYITVEAINERAFK